MLDYMVNDLQYPLETVWDSNPRAREGKTISSRSRYDHFDTSPQHIPFYQNKVICQ